MVYFVQWATLCSGVVGVLNSGVFCTIGYIVFRCGGCLKQWCVLYNGLHCVPVSWVFSTVVCESFSA